jgi:hypothetical protein
MTCVLGKNRITCYHTPFLAKGRIKVKDGSEYWINLTKDVYDVLKPDAVLAVYEEHGVGQNFVHVDKKYLKRFTEWTGTVVEYLQRLEDETDKKCKEVKEYIDAKNNIQS